MFIVDDGNGNREAIPSEPPPKKAEEKPKEPPKESK